MDFIKNLLLQLSSTIGVIIIVGFLLYLFNFLILNTAQNGRGFYRLTGLIGTPLHEFGHLIFCYPFGLKVEDVKFYNFDKNDKVLGYVNFSYNKKNIFQRIGMFFVAVGPITIGTLVLILLLRICLPGAFSAIFSNISMLEGNNFSFKLLMQGVFDNVGILLHAIFNIDNLTNFRWWIFIILGVCISMHMNLSPQDMKGGLKGLGIILFIYSIVSLIIYIVSKNTCYKITSILLSFSSVLLALGLLSVTILALNLVISLIITFLSTVEK